MRRDIIKGNRGLKWGLYFLFGVEWGSEISSDKGKWNGELRGRTK